VRGTAVNHMDVMYADFAGAKTCVYAIHEDIVPCGYSSTELMYRTYGIPILQEQKSVTLLSRKKDIFGGALQNL